MRHWLGRFPAFLRRAQLGCDLHCTKPACVLHQRDQLREAYLALLYETRDLQQLLRVAEHTRPRATWRTDLHNRSDRPTESPPSNVVPLDP